jgi:hypothetical protein
MSRKIDRGRRADHWIYLDRSWAHRLGVRRTAGVYRIRSRELARRLSLETLWVDASGAVHAYGSGTAAADINRNNGMSRDEAHPKGVAARGGLWC